MNLLSKSFIAAAFAMTLAAPAWAQIKIGGLYELSGAGASVGNNFKIGVDVAIQEINAAGGILGKKIEHSVSDTQGSPGVAKGEGCDTLRFGRGWHNRKGEP